MKKKFVDDRQLSLFESTPPKKSLFDVSKKELEKPKSVIDYMRERLEHGSELTEEERKRWVRFLVNHSLKRWE